MNILKWISFGTWVTPLPERELDGIILWVVLFLITTSLKVFLMILKDYDLSNKRRQYGRFICIGARLLQGLWYAVLFSIIGLFHSPILYIVVLFYMIYNIIIVLAIGSGDYETFIWKINNIIHDKAISIGEYIKDNISLNVKCKQINKKIDGYLKTAIIK